LSSTTTGYGTNDTKAELTAISDPQIIVSDLRHR
jgi:hypothetical protein